MIKHIANIVTGCRVLGSVMLLFFPACSAAFCVVYLLCGFSDMIDGTIARKTNSMSELGAKLDTAADLTFVCASLIKLLPIVKLPPWLWIWGIVIAVIKFGNIIGGYAGKKQFISLHTIANKIAGLALFLLPLTLSFVEVEYSAIAVCSIATFAAIQEGVCIAINSEKRS